ncbi:conserved hypothetical protein [Desulfohalobium retbaense DSM 5692]|uniref:Uncharacterized protein n=2 Tax=Desulfohalobium TaxID=45662 RepID=C8X1F8_DESRD|nr:conserved hypothetical protein [Desulfohalobium retbaense DSM 5692]
MIEMVLRHDGANWIASNEHVTASGDSLEDLDVAVTRTIKGHGSYQGTGTHRVWMYFDNSTLPGWIRQYMPHYFNRTIDVHT